LQALGQNNLTYPVIFIPKIRAFSLKSAQKS
jgi:hypothetical protein